MTKSIKDQMLEILEDTKNFYKTENRGIVAEGLAACTYFNEKNETPVE